LRSPFPQISSVNSVPKASIILHQLSDFNRH
jgi:hypothetical protein